MDPTVDCTGTLEHEKYLKAAPSDFERSRAYCSIAEVYFRKGELNRASAAAARGMKHCNLAAWVALLLALERGDAKTTQQLKLLVSELVPPISRGQRETARITLYRCGYIDLREGRAAAAIEDFKEALRHPPPYWAVDPFEDCLANACLKLGRWNEAIAEYERVLKLNSKYPLADYHLARAYDQKGDPGQAQSAYERFLEVWDSADDDVPEVVAAKERLAQLKTTN